MSEPKTPSQISDFQPRVLYDHFHDCVHCGLCTSACPTYLELGTEADGPRGRIHLMKAVTDGRLEMNEDVERHLDLCLDCRACETACPSGVQYGRLIEPFRVAIEERRLKRDGATALQRFVLFPLFPYANRLRWALWPARIAQMFRLDRLALDVLKLDRLLPASLRQLVRMLPTLRSSPPLPERLPAIGKKRATVALLLGCVADAVFRPVHWATARVLQANGCEVLIPRGQTCCGAIHYHAGAEAPAIQRAIQNAKAVDVQQLDAVIVNVAGCGAMLKEYSHLNLPAGDRPAVEAFSAKVKDIHEFLFALGPIRPTHAINRTAVYHDACHLVHAQQVRTQPRELLAMIPGLKLQPIDEADVCCGAAGSYNLVQPEMAGRLADRKAKAILAADPELLLSPNAGCHLHLGRRLKELGRNLWIGHPMELLQMSYEGKQPELRPSPLKTMRPG